MWFLTGCSCNSLSCPYGASSSRIYLVHTRERWGLRLMFLYWNDFQGFEHSMLFYCFQNASHLDLFPPFPAGLRAKTEDSDTLSWDRDPSTCVLFSCRVVTRLSLIFYQERYEADGDRQGVLFWSWKGNEGCWGWLKLLAYENCWSSQQFTGSLLEFVEANSFWNNSTRWWFPNILLNFHP